MRRVILRALLLALVTGCSAGGGIDVPAAPGGAGGPGGKGDDPDEGRADPCNGQDDDGDGFTDLDPDGNPLSRPCETACGAGSEYCEGGTWVCYAPTPHDETCDSFDNDCDGEVDEGCACRVGDTRECGREAVGVCHGGAQTCQGDGSWGACTGEVGPGTEECGNGLDDDCNGEVDETCGCAPGSEQACGDDTGECTAGTQVCSATGQWGDCEGSQGATEEICNGLDDDCDGTPDQPWQEDDYEPNAACSRAYDLGDVTQYGDALVLEDASLYAPRDEDWYRVRMVEADEWCFPGFSECSHHGVFVVSIPEGLDHQDVEVCAMQGACTETVDAGRTFCSHATDWDRELGAYVLGVIWGGTCGYDDTSTWQLVVRSNADASCGNYGLSVQYDMTEDECPE